MAVFNEPTKWAQTLGKDADVTTIPDTAGETDPSIDKIFPSVFSIPLAQGGRAIPRSVLNGLFKLLGDWTFYQQNGGIASYSATFDYAVGSFVKYNNEFYRCIQANGASSTIKAPTDTAYWSKITTLADVAGTFANQSFSNVNDTANILMAHNAKPSSKGDNLTPVNESYYTAPADGFYKIKGTAEASGQYIALQGRVEITVYAPAANAVIETFIPCSKGESVRLAYNVSTIDWFTFVYANGSESEQ